MDKLYDATEFNNIKEILYNSVQKFNANIAFVIKHKIDKEISYENISYTRLLEDVNKVGTSLFNIGLKGKRVHAVSPVDNLGISRIHFL